MIVITVNVLTWKMYGGIVRFVGSSHYRLIAIPNDELWTWGWHVTLGLFSSLMRYSRRVKCGMRDLLDYSCLSPTLDANDKVEWLI